MREAISFYLIAARECHAVSSVRSFFFIKTFVNTHESNVLLTFLLFLGFAIYLRVDVMQPKLNHVSGVFIMGEPNSHQSFHHKYPIYHHSQNGVST